MRPSNASPSPERSPHEGHAPSSPSTASILAALELIPAGAFVLTASYAETRGGVVVRWVQQVSSAPPLVVVAIEKGQPLSPVIRDSRRFGLCQLGDDDRVLYRLFEPERADSPRMSVNSRFESIDPFLGVPTRMTPTGVPVLLKSLAWLECELTRHLDVEGNCELYIGLVHDGGVLRLPAPPAETPPPAPTAKPLPHDRRPKRVVGRETDRDVGRERDTHASQPTLSDEDERTNGHGKSVRGTNGHRTPSERSIPRRSDKSPRPGKPDR